MSHSALAPFLNPLVDDYARVDLLSTDPLGLVYELAGEDPRNQEIVGLLASGLAYGRVSIIQKSTREVLRRMNGDPIAFVENYSPEIGERAFRGWKHRLNRGHDLQSLCAGLQVVYGEYGSLGSFFMQGYERGRDPDIGPALASFTERFLSLPQVETRPEKRGLPGVGWLFSNPKKGSACKRMNLFLRWMVRPSFPDLGIWSGVATSELVMPVDTHVARICRYLGLSSRASGDWKMAAEITAGLRVLDPDDPVRYDWAISRLGIMDHCPSRKVDALCATCPLFPVCTA